MLFSVKSKYLSIIFLKITYKQKSIIVDSYIYHMIRSSLSIKLKIPQDLQILNI